MVAARAPQREEYLARVLISVRERLGSASLDAEVTGRPKHLWSIYEKDGGARQGIRRHPRSRGHPRRGRLGEGLLGRSRAIHAIWPPVQGRFKDYINTPKFNLYQVAAHHGHRFDGKPIESRCAPTRCTVAPSTASPPTGATRRRTTPPRTWPGCNASPRSARTRTTRSSSLEALKLDLEQDEVYVFHPEGTGDRPAGPVHAGRLRYAIHTEVGHRCIGARVNGRLVPLDTRLNSADTVEIFTSKSATAGALA